MPITNPQYDEQETVQEPLQPTAQIEQQPSQEQALAQKLEELLEFVKWQDQQIQNMQQQLGQLQQAELQRQLGTLPSLQPPATIESVTHANAEAIDVSAPVDAVAYEMSASASAPAGEAASAAPAGTAANAAATGETRASSPFFAEASPQAENTASTITIPDRPRLSALAIFGLLFGIAAIATSFFTVTDMASLALALIGAVLAIAGIVATRKRRKRGRWIAVLGLLVSVGSVVFILMTQSFYLTTIGSFIDNLQHGSTPASASASASSASAAGGSTSATSATGTSASAASTSAALMSLGTTKSLDSGLTISVASSQSGLKNADNATMTCVTVTYANMGSKALPYNALDWKAQGSSGALQSPLNYPDGTDALIGGDLAPGGTVTGNVFFEGTVVKAFYFENAYAQTESNIGWTLGG